jgi:hypothetical protein
MRLRLLCLSLLVLTACSPADPGGANAARDAQTRGAARTNTAGPIEPSWVYINRDIGWGAGGRGIGQSTSHGVAEFAIFYPTGGFAYVICLLARDAGGGAIKIPARLDDFYVRQGTWLCHGGDGAVTPEQERTVTVTSRRTHGPQEDGSSGETIDRWKTERPCASLGSGGSGAITGPRHTYVPLASLNGLADRAATLERLAEMIATGS